MNVTIYDAVNFGGRSATLAAGSYKLSGSGAPLDKVASIQVPAGLVALVYEAADNAGGFGRSADLMENYADVTTLGMTGIAYITVFASERNALVLADAVVKAPTPPITINPAAHEFWARGAVVNEQYVAGHWIVAGTQPTAPGPAVVSPGPLPHLLHIAKLDGSDWTNPAFNTSANNWSSQVVGGSTCDGSNSHPFEWVSVLNPTIEQDDEVGVAGFAIAPDLSGADVPFTHPFGNDYEFAIVPDAEYAGLLAPSNRSGSSDDTINNGFAQGRSAGLAVTGILPMEVEAGMVPSTYRAAAGDRVAVYGRWIVDAGHNDFHTEIHPPLLLARAQTVNAQGATVYPDAGAITYMQLWSRPYQAAQKFKDGSNTNLCLQDYITNIAETLGDIVAYPPIFPKSLGGVYLVSLVVRPPVPTPPPAKFVVLGPAHLQCSYSFTTNKACGVEIMQCVSDPNAVQITLALNSAGYPTLPDPPSTKVAWSLDALKKSIPPDLGTLTSFLVDVVSAYQNTVHGGNVYFRTYNPVPAPNVTTHAVPFTPLASLPRSSVNVDNTQPFPIIGWLKLQWVHTSTIVVGGGGSGLHQVTSAQ